MSERENVVRLILGVLLSFYSLTSFAFPTELSGTWAQPNIKEFGAMFVHVHEHTEHTLTGVIEIRGSKDCREPILFRGVIELERVLIESTAAIVCGHAGRLTGEVARESADVYVGNFRYTYPVFGWSLTIASGGFRLVPVIKNE